MVTIKILGIFSLLLTNVGPKTCHSPICLSRKSENGNAKPEVILVNYSPRLVTYLISSPHFSLFSLNPIVLRHLLFEGVTQVYVTTYTLEANRYCTLRVKGFLDFIYRPEFK